MLLGDAKFIEESRIWQRRMGGTVFNYLPLVASAQYALKNHLDTFPARFEKLKYENKLKNLTKAEK